MRRRWGAFPRWSCRAPDCSCRPGTRSHSALSRCARDHSLRGRMGARAREHALLHYSIDRLLRDIETLYGELMEGPRLP